MIYAGVGARSTPDDILKVMRTLAETYARAGWMLRSGGAAGADSAFALGCEDAGGKCEIIRPMDATEQQVELASQYHPAWHRCSGWARLAHGRNAAIILGKNLDEPVEQVWCWTPNGETVGGTGMAIRIAEAYDIHVMNLANPYHMSLAMATINSIEIDA